MDLGGLFIGYDLCVKAYDAMLMGMFTAYGTVAKTGEGL
jgi:hypothetical protein